MWHSTQGDQHNGMNYSGIALQEIDDILDAYRVEFDERKRIDLYRRLQEIIHEEQPYAFLWMPRRITAYSKRFKGVSWYPGGHTGTDFRAWWVAEGDQVYKE